MLRAIINTIQSPELRCYRFRWLKGLCGTCIGLHKYVINKRYKDSNIKAYVNYFIVRSVTGGENEFRSRVVDRQKFMTLLFAGTVQYDRKYNKTLSLHIMNVAWNIPNKLFDEPEYDEMSYVCDILDFEYGTFDAMPEEYPDWVNRYYAWKAVPKKHP